MRYKQRALLKRNLRIDELKRIIETTERLGGDVQDAKMELHILQGGTYGIRRRQVRKLLELDKFTLPHKEKS